MNYGSVCSGIEAATTAWRPLGWKAKFFAEVEPFPAAVLCHRYGATRPLRPLDPAEAADGKDRKLREAWARQLPGLPEGGDIPNLGDFTKIQKEDYEGDIDLLVGGTPCQSYSIAGLRRGLSDPRGNLALEFVRLAYRSDARWTVWENVPGVLSSGGGGDFASFLSLLCGWEVPVPKDGWGKCGIVTNAPGCYGLAWRILDAQYTRVPMFPRAIPQRRRRIFVVGYRGGAVGSPLDWQHPAAVLFDGEMRERDTPPRREAAPGASPASPGGAEAPGQRGVVSLIPYGMRLGAHEDGVASTIARIDAKFPQCVCREEEQQREKNGFNFELFTGECREHSPCLGATRASDTMVYDGEEPETIRMREGCSGGGKGPLISRNVSLTLATANDQTLFEKKAVWWDGSEKADTLTCTSDAQRMPDKKKLQCVLDMRQIEANGTDVSPTLISTDYKGGKAVVETPGGESPEGAVCPTFEANLFNKNTFQDCDKFLIEKHGDEPVCFTQNQRDEIRLLGGDGQVAGAVCSMQATKQQNFIAYENHAQDSRVKDVGDVSPTLTGQMGTGGNNQPFVQKINAENDMEDAEKEAFPAGKPLAFIKNDAGGIQQGYWEDVFPTMRTDITPAVAQRECFSITPCDANGTRADRPDGGLYVTQADASKTLTRGNPNTETVVVEPPVISLDGDKMGKADRAGGSGLGVNADDVMYTQTVKDVHAVAYGASFEPNYGCPVEEELAHTQKCGTAPGTYNGVMTVDVGCDLYNGKETGRVAATMSANSCATPTRNGPAIVKVDTVVDMMGGKSGCHVSQENVSPTLATTHGESHAVAYGINCQASLMHPFSEEVSQVLSVAHQSGVVQDECVPIDMRNATRDADKLDGVNRQGVGVGEDGAPAPTVTASPGGVGWRATVRRLLPVETERLMGFPDDFTKIPWKGKPAEECPDAPRYKACGNSMCTNVMNWIGLRIQQEEEKIQDERKRQHEEHG
jgi:site-specific DNA-cytosine methylase